MTREINAKVFEKTKGHCHFCGDPVEFDKRGWADGDLAGFCEVGLAPQTMKRGRDLIWSGTQGGKPEQHVHLFASRTALGCIMAGPPRQARSAADDASPHSGDLGLDQAVHFTPDGGS